MPEPKPVVIGYIRDSPLLQRSQMYEMQGRMIRHAQSMNLVISALFVEEDAMAQTSFDKAFARLDKWGPRYLFVPALDHLDHLGGKPALEVVADLTARGIEVQIVA